MKNFAFVLLTMFFVGMTFTSCSNDCQTCDCSGTSTEYCEDDFGSGLLFDTAIASYEASGCTCE